MRPITILRGVAWFGLAVVAWSLNIVWGLDADAGKGPPTPVERHVMGAGLLALISAVSISASGRGDMPPSNRARGIAVGAALLVMLLVLLVRNKASSLGFTHWLEGSGFRWMLAGGGLVLGAAVGTFALKPPDKAKGASATSSGSGRGGKSAPRNKKRGKSSKKTRGRK